MAQDESVDLHAQVETLEQSLHNCRTRLRSCLAENARLKLDLEAREARELAFRERLQKVEDRESRVEDETSSRAMDLRELRYRNKQLVAELADAKEKHRGLQAKTRSRLSNLASSLQETECKNEERGRAIRIAVNAIQNAVLDLQRHIGSKGFHAVNSNTAIRLVNKIFEAAEDLACAADVSSRRNVQSLQKLQRKAYKSTVKDNAKRGVVSVAKDDGKADLLEEVTAVCGDLEQENERLRGNVQVLKAQLESCREQAEKAQLIPKYRLVIVQSRAQAAALRSQVEELSDENERLRREQLRKQPVEDVLLERGSLADLETLTSQLKRARNKISALLKENAALKSEVTELGRLNKAREEVLQDASVTRAAFESSVIAGEDLDLSAMLNISTEEGSRTHDPALTPLRSPIHLSTQRRTASEMPPEDLQSEIQKLNMDISDLQQALKSIKD